jgi:hypothetical protein
MPGFVVGGGKVDAEGFLKSLLLAFTPGYATGLNVTQRGAGSNMSVDVNVNTSGYAGGLLATSANVPYIGYIAATENVTVNASDPTNPRIDTLVAYADLSVISTSITDNTGAFKFKSVAGTPAGSPSAPSAGTIQTSIGAGNPYMTLANIAVAASAGSIVNANITDTRVPMAFKVGYLIGGSANVKGQQVPNVADAFVGITSRSDGKIGFSELITTIFSGQVQTQTNTGTAGGTMSYLNLGGVKFLWCSTGNLTTSIAGNNYGFTLPVSFFSSIALPLASAINPSVNVGQFANVNSFSASSVNVYLVANANGGTAGVSLLLMGA